MDFKGKVFEQAAMPSPRNADAIGRAAAEVEALIRVQVERNASVKSIAKAFGVVERRVRSFRAGVPWSHHAGPRPRTTKEIRSFIETNFLGYA
jgi:hypothetical protein